MTNVPNYEERVAALERALQRERKARIAAEETLTKYSRDAYFTTQLLRQEVSQYLKSVKPLAEQTPLKGERQGSLPHPSIRPPERFTLLGQLAAGIAHEVNNPLSFLKCNCDILDQLVLDLRDAFDEIASRLQERDPEGASRFVASLHEKYMLDDIAFITDDISKSNNHGFERISQIVQALKAFTYPAQQHVAPVSVYQILDEVVVALVPQLPEHVHVVLPDNSQDFCVMAQHSHLKTALDHVVKNAVQACGNEGTVTVEIGRVKDQVEIAISDTGHGIEPNHRDFLFIPFFTTREPGDGMGLGLVLSRAIIESFGGTLRFKPEDDYTTFICSLPISDT